MTDTDTAPVVPAISIALHSLTSHLVDHRLPAPKNLELRPAERLIQVHIDATHLPAWLTSGFAVDGRTVTGFDHLSPPTRNWGRVDVDGRLPDSGVRVRLSFFQRAAVEAPTRVRGGLRAVTA